MIDRRPAFTTTRTRFLVLLMVSLTSIGFVAAGGRQEEPTQDTGTRIEIQDPDERDSDNSKDATPDVTEPTTPETVPIDRPAWLVAVHANAENMQEEISETIDNGYIPVGMELSTEGALTVLYTVALQVVPERWLLESYAPEEVDAELSQRFLEGWNPLAFSVLNNQLVVMLGSGGADVDAWRVHQTDLDQNVLDQTIESYRDDGYGIVDISIDPQDSKLWYLFVRQEGRASAGDNQLFLNAYPEGEETVAGISTDYTRGRGMPYGFAVGDAISLVLFVGND